MDKCKDKFCPYCWHHLYQNGDGEPYWCAACDCQVRAEDAATFDDVAWLRDDEVEA